MTTTLKTLAAIAAGAAIASTAIATGALAESAREIRAPSPYNAVENEPPPRLIVAPPLPGPLARGIVQIQYRVENVRILPVFGAAALAVSPRVGHLHVRVDDLPWWWAETADNNNTIDFAGVPPGEHQVRIDLVDAAHNIFPGQSVTVTFTVPRAARRCGTRALKSLPATAAAGARRQRIRKRLVKHVTC